MYHYILLASDQAHFHCNFIIYASMKVSLGSRLPLHIHVALTTSYLHVLLKLRKTCLFVSVGVVMSRSVTLVKGKNNMIGISIGGGAPMCPVLYVVQVCCDARASSLCKFLKVIACTFN